MNTAAQIKSDLISRIENIHDLNFLQAIQTILDSSNKELFELSDDQIKSIDQRLLDIENGNTIPHKKVMQDIRGWIKDK